MLRRSLSLAALLLAGGSLQVSAAGLTSLELLGQSAIPGTTQIDGVPLGGLSGLTFDPRTGRYLALSDDRSENGLARFYRLKVDLPAAGSAATAPVVTVEAAVTLVGPGGAPFGRRSLDPEGIAIGGVGGSAQQRLYISSEGEARVGQAPFVDEFDLAGRFVRELPLPGRYRPAVGAAVGVRNNLGFEALSLTPDGRYLLAGTENGLAQESPAAAPGVSSRTRLLRWDLERGGAPDEFLYVVEAVSVTPPSPSDFIVNGLVEAIALDRDELLTLERQWVPGVGIEMKLFAVALAGVPNVATVDPPASLSLATANKTLLLNFADLGLPLDNFEGMTLGPPLADGRRPLIIVSDDNFNPDIQKTLVLAFAAGFEPLAIAAVQGSAHRSPLAGRWVAGIEGVVTATEDSPRAKGFWMESATPDADAATSEGIYVAWEGAFTLHPGDRVRVGGRVEEVANPASALPVTTLRLVALEPLPAAGAALPPPVRLIAERRIPLQVDDDGLTKFEPGSDTIDFWESLEGMRVTVPPGTIVGATRTFGDVVLLADGADTAGAVRTPVGGVRQPAPGQVFERIFLSRRLSGTMPDFQVGDRIATPQVGIVDYAFSNYRVQLLAAPPVEPDASTRPACGERTRLSAEKGKLTVASFNAENLSIARDAARIPGLGRAIAEALAAPAIVALDEIQDDSGPADDGVVTAQATLAALVEAIAAAGGPHYRPVVIDPENDRDGGQPGGNIRVALLFDPARVELVERGAARANDPVEIVGRGGTMGLSLSPGRLAPTSSAFDLRAGEGVRKSLVAQFRAGGHSLFVVANHWTSKWDDDRAFGLRQPPRTPTAARRLAQAKVVREFVDRLLGGDPQARIVVLGDLNESEKSDGVAALGAPPMTNLALAVPEADRYSYIFEGGSEVIDHIVVSPALANGAEIDFVHLNSNCPDSLRLSDHDPVVARIRIR
ncbi:MAG: esterase-like activity of phytase family protein [Thermoanaerobaculia bacterium]